MPFTMCVAQALNDMHRMLSVVLTHSIRRDIGSKDAQRGLVGGFAPALPFAIAGAPISRTTDQGLQTSIIALSIGFWSLMTAVQLFTR